MKTEGCLIKLDGGVCLISDSETIKDSPFSFVPVINIKMEKFEMKLRAKITK